MAARKLQQEIERTFKKVQEGIVQFEQIYEKLQQCQNASQKEKLEDSLKSQIKKLQRQRDQIKTWAANSEIKDKKPLLDERKRIETQMEKFKAVEKEMKTKAYSKEGLQASARLDPKEQRKQDVNQFLTDCNSDLDRQIETAEAEIDSLTAVVKKGKKDPIKADRIQELEKASERHKWHQSRIELIIRLLDNGNLEVEQVEAIKDEIKWYIESNNDPDFTEEEFETLYDDLNLDDEFVEDLYGLGNDVERQSSQDATSVQDDLPEVKPTVPGKGEAGRRPSSQVKSPLPTLAALPAPLASNGSAMKPAPLPARPAGELKYASVATAAAAAEKNVGIAPLPPPPGMEPVRPVHASPVPAPAVPSLQRQTSRPNNSPRPTQAVPVLAQTPSQSSEASPTTRHVEPTPPPEPVIVDEEPFSESPEPEEAPIAYESNGTNGYAAPTEAKKPEGDEECVYHLPPGLQDVMSSFELSKKRTQQPDVASVENALRLSYLNCPDSLDSERPNRYKPARKYNTPAHYPQTQLPIFSDPALYHRVDSDTLFYVFYYRQGTYQQFLAARELKKQSWRFHKQYATWFQRHEEPKTITEDYEQGTYRFFDYESTWMNRRKNDFKFVYKYLEDDLTV